MRKIINVLFCSSLYFVSYSQNIFIKDYDNLKKTFFPKENDKIKLMKDNWFMFFKEDVLAKLDSNIATSAFEIKLDSYGSLYPESEVLNFVDKNDFENKKNKNFEAQSFYKLFKNHKIEIKNGIKEIQDKIKQKYYEDLIALSENSTDEKFSYLWDSIHRKELNKKFNRKIKNDKITRVIFFVHGYNVPYSLAVLQAITVYKESKKYFNENEKVLLVPVYWPSNDKKLDSLRQENFSTLNIKKFKNNGKLFLRYTNRCYMAAISLRNVINSIEDDSLKIDIVAHSLGAVIATSCLINTTTKIQYSNGEINLNNAKNKKFILAKNLNEYNFSSGNYTNLDILKGFYKDSIPTRKVNVFLSAAAIPGETTFCDLDSFKLRNNKIYVTINKYDEMVSKNEIRIQVKKKTRLLFGGLNIKQINSKRLGDTSLGCNASCDAFNSKELYNKKVDSENFKIKIVSNELDHDIFTYIQQESYKDFFKDFIKAQ